MAPPTGYVITNSSLQPIRSANDTEEFRRNYGANEFVNALYALDHGYTGQGVVVGVMDSGAQNVNGELDGRISELSKDFGYVYANDGTRTKRNAIGDENAIHGTSVANVLGANRNGIGEQGYAPDVKLAILRISDTMSDKSQSLTHFEEALDYAGANHIKVVNASWVTWGDTTNWREALKRFVPTGGLVVQAAGNSAGSDPVNIADYTADTKAALLFVVALAPNIKAYELAAYSNKAGAAMERTVTAPGANVTTDVNGNWSIFEGSSSAAPVVTALVATILSKWPQLTGQQAGDVVLNTAKDIGDPGTDPVFGRGLVDFQAALSPVNPTLSNGSASTALSASVMAVPAAMGTGAIKASLASVTVLDSYGRDFSGSLAGMVVTPEVHSNSWMRRRVAQSNSNGDFTIAQGPLSGRLGVAAFRTSYEGAAKVIATNGEVNYATGGGIVKAAWNAQDSLQSDLMGLAPFSDGILAYAPQAGNSLSYERYIGRDRLSLKIAGGKSFGLSAKAATFGWSTGDNELRFSMIDETGSVMGMPTGEGALRLGAGAITAMIEGHRSFGDPFGWQIETYGSLGMTRLKVDRSSLVTGSDAIVASRFGVQAKGHLAGGLMSFGFAQPLTIERGAVRITRAIAYDVEHRSLVYSTSRASVAGQRRMQLTAGYAAGGARSSLRVGLMQDVTDGSTSALTAWSLHF